MIDQMKNNKELARQAFANRPGGGNMDDAQWDMMLNMMTPEMLRMSMKFAQENPEIVR